MSESADTEAPPSSDRKSLLLLLPLTVVSLVTWFIGTEYNTLADTKRSIAHPSSYVQPLIPIDADDDDDEGYPDKIFSKDWLDAVAVKDMTHLSTLQIACTEYNESVIPWDMMLDGNRAEVLINETDPEAYEKLRQCQDVDIYLPSGLRGFGYCEDAAAYTKFLRGRMLLKWVLDKKFTDPKTGRTDVSYHEMCPDTPILFMNHYWDGLRDDPKWPATKPTYLMPNIEMYELEALHFRRSDVVICKTAVCAKYVRKWLAQEGNPTNTQVIYSRHTSSNLASFARELLGEDAIASKNFTHPKFVHIVGSSRFKATGHVLECWLSRPDFPPIDIYIAEKFYKRKYEERFAERIKASPNVNLYPGRVDSVTLGKIVAEASFFMCPSFQEGYGHYINQARAAGGLVVTTDIPPMNELITPQSGMVFPVDALSSQNQFLGGTSKHPKGLHNVTGFVAGFDGNDVCDAVDTLLLTMPPQEREERALRAKQQYHFDTLYFAEKMQKLRIWGRRKQGYMRQEAVP
ncbi:hypothetical protein Poli38472_013206 [Pythium oligandrum]|uniref:Glycosyl transferase family 1 domain-containing protein n=1 Tax=Pythium oligandrum TaxID=41045 RepID=A0A8K1C2M2_PYTOL|nr:hypothetical protein Poli38472_013206 [Pythium oligandrum]|eukprot:TMW55315.1 hypothetical protein Poli38472_013206 [Pythium oligandrum]